METSGSPVRHRLELLERTVYALQAQQRVLEYRMQYVEDENKALRQALSSKEAQEAAGLGKSSLQSFVQPAPATPNASSNHNAYGTHLRSLAATEMNGKDTSVTLSSQSLQSLSLLDEPTLLSTPILTPASKGTIPINNGTTGAKFPALTPSNSTRAQSRLVGTSQEFVSALTPSKSSRTQSSLVASSPEFVPALPTSQLLSDSTELTNATQAATVVKKQDVVPWDGTIAWKFIRLFKDKDEEKQAMLYSMGDCEIKLQDEWIFQYGLRYLPKADDKDIYRTIRIENLPENTTLDKVLAEVCYGDVLSAALLNTFPITGYHTARVVFVHQQSAMKFCKYAKKKGLVIQGVRACVALEKTATYPVGQSLEESITRYGCTRCLTITKATESLVTFIEETLADTYLKDCVETYSKEYIDMVQDEDAETTLWEEEVANIKIFLSFHSVKAALFAYRMFQRDQSLDSSVLKFAKDPCNRVPV